MDLVSKRLEMVGKGEKEREREDYIETVGMKAGNIMAVVKKK